MARRWTNDLSRSDVTPHDVYLNRRSILAGLGFGGGLATFPRIASAQKDELEPNSFEEITSYNNYYEFGTGKTDPKENSDQLTISPWPITIDGLVDKPGEYAFEDVLAQMDIEDRIYRLRCVEAWSMVVPWQGFELADLLALAGPKPEAKFVEFQTLLRPEEMPGQEFPILDWPYIEGLRIDEAMHPLTIMATGLYDQALPKQNGAPMRLVVPWKYGFKSGKAIVRITLTDTQPLTTWAKAGPAEYGFYANVNPNVDHPRWSQDSERRVGGGLFSRRIDTLLFNGYEEVASLYEGMDLEKNF